MATFNPLNFQGPEFLGFYILFAAAIIFAARQIVRGDRTDKMKPAAVPEAPDPIEVAFLSGGLRQVAQTVIYGLACRGLVEIKPDGFFISISKKPDLDLDPVDAYVLEILPRALSMRGAVYFLKDDEGFARLLGPVRRRVAAQHLVLPMNTRFRFYGAVVVGGGVLIALAAAKTNLALAAGHKNVGFLIFICLVSLLCLASLTWPRADRLTKRGKAYLEALKLAYGDQRCQLVRAANESENVFAEGLLFIVGLYGMSVLFADKVYADAMGKASKEGYGSCGCSAGGGSCGGGCGGGCGGCGG
jgi:uncharacterized protein (TIGR04222 family)